MRTARPTGFQNHAGGKDFVQRSFGLLNAVAPFVQAFAGTVNRQRAVVVRNMYINVEVGIVDADGRTLAELLGEIINNGIFRAVSHKLGMIEVFGIDNGVNGKGRFRRHVILPCHLLGFRIHCIGIFGFEVINRFENAEGGAAAKVDFVKQLLVPRERDHAAACLQIAGT
ncbi:hypothetical protein Barb7_03138 [Bacteroidales bacterium Barb7]|nr:hypothetical protein Barb7_03138 [Bacteroidales bacterium Barb7]